jgi:protein disulfide-isomerase A1
LYIVSIRQVAPAITVVTGGDDLKKARESDDLVVVGFFEEQSEEGETFQKVAEKLRNDFTFVRMDAAPAEYKGARLMAFKKFDEPEVRFEGKFTEQALTEFINGESIPLAAEIGPENYTKYIDSGLPLAYFFYADDKQKEAYTKAVTAAAKAVKGKVNTVFINGGLYGQHAEVLNIEQKWPAFVVHDMSQDRDLKYPLPKGDKMSPESLTKFVESFVKGSLKPSFKSEPIPSAKEDKGPVRVLVHDNFEKVAFDKSKDVLVEIYAPWCGACKRIAPDYESLAKAIAAQTDKVVLAKMDGVANDITASLNIRLEHFPTFKLIKAGSNEIATFDGALTYNELAAWLESNATTKFAVERVAEPEAAADEDSELDDESSRDEL